MNMYQLTNYELPVLNKKVKDLEIGDKILNYVVVDKVKVDKLSDLSATEQTLYKSSSYLMNEDYYMIQLNNIATNELGTSFMEFRGDDSVSKLLNMNLS